MSPIAYIFFVALIFASINAAPFTPGNFIISYVNESYDDLASTDIYPTFIEELTPDGTSVQTIEISSSCSTNSNVYQGAPRLSTDGQYVTFACYIPNGVTTDINQLTSAVGVLNQNGDLDTSTQFKMPSGKYWYRSIKDGDDIYIAGDYTISYIPFGGSQNDRIELGTVQKIQDVYIYEGNLLVTNYNDNGFGLAQVGSGLPVNTTNQNINQIWGSEITMFPDTIKFFEQNGEKYAYLSQESPYTLYKLKFVAGSWTKLYNIAENANNNIISSQIFYDNGDNTTTVLFALDKTIYKTIDDGSQFSAISTLVTRPDFVIKGIEKVPVEIIVPPVTPISEPITTPVHVPAAHPTNLVPISEPNVDHVPIGDVPMNGPITNSEPVKSTPSARTAVNSAIKLDTNLISILLYCIVAVLIQ